VCILVRLDPVRVRVSEEREGEGGKEERGEDRFKEIIGEKWRERRTLIVCILVRLDPVRVSE
jgi:hypothetical protein